MTESEIKTLAVHGLFHNKALRGKVEETHISWVVLTRQNAFKIKKPLKLSFLDFSSLRLRKEYCGREISLNSRYTDIYLGVEPIRFWDGKWLIGGEKGKVVDYAVHMKRMAVAKRMDKMLRQGKVHEVNIHALAEEIAPFHQNAKKIYTPFNLSTARNTFNDIKVIKKAVSVQLDLAHAELIDQCIQWSNSFLASHANRLQERIGRGFKRDVHGDLHSGNIFLYKKPVLFDCIEFNDIYRQIDVLYEIAFFCMDLEAFRQKQFAGLFLKEYSRIFNCFEVKEDEAIFTYFKCLRANIRAKVHAMSALQAHNPEEAKRHADETRKYLNLMRLYMDIQA